MKFYAIISALLVSSASAAATIDCPDKVTITAFNDAKCKKYNDE